jgi:hypothetical protein
MLATTDRLADRLADRKANLDMRIADAESLLDQLAADADAMCPGPELDATLSRRAAVARQVRCLHDQWVGVCDQIDRRGTSFGCMPPAMESTIADLRDQAASAAQRLSALHSDLCAEESQRDAEAEIIGRMPWEGDRAEQIRQQIQQAEHLIDSIQEQITAMVGRCA